jgi:predicted nuclease with TOPRIM domain
MFNDDRPEFQALDELRAVLQSLTGELGSWRRRALKAEADQTELGLGHDVVASREQMLSLESQNATLEQRMDAARGRISDLLTRLQFLEEQVAAEEHDR